MAPSWAGGRFRRPPLRAGRYAGASRSVHPPRAASHSTPRAVRARFACMAAQRPGPRSANAAVAWSALNAIPQGVVICAGDWTILYVTRAAALLLGRTVESLIGTLLWEA